MNEDFTELDKVFDSILDEIDNPGRSYGNADIFRNLHGERTEYADYAKVVHTIVVRVADDNMSAAINVISTAEKKRRYNIGELNRAIHAKGIVYGIDSEALMRMVLKQLFNRDVVFARGIPAQNGIDGYIEQLVKFEDDKDFANVKDGTPICRVVPPQAGVIGSDIFGHAIPFVNGVAVEIPMGENTVYDKKTGILSAKEGGRLTLKNGVYSINDEYVVNGNVTKDTGKIEFAGNVIVNGNVIDGGFIVCEKNVTVKGKVGGGAAITAKGDISVELAVKNATIITEKGNMHLMSCTDSVIKCGGDLDASSINNCDTRCAGSIDCTANQGSVNGGETRCIGTLKCITAGSRLREKTFISVGDCSEYIAEKIILERSLSRIEGEIEKISRRISTLEIQKNDLGFLSREDEDFLVAAKRIKTQKEGDKLPIIEKIEETERIIKYAEDSVFKVQRFLHSNVTLQIKSYMRNIDGEMGRVVAYTTSHGIIFS